jgi:large subunit ribosomal protein L33
LAAGAEQPCVAACQSGIDFGGIGGTLDPVVSGVDARPDKLLASRGGWPIPKLWRTTIMREIITLQCPTCKNRNYSTTKNKKTTTGRLEFSKFCNTCRKHTAHKETK